MKIRDVMTTDVITAHVDMPFKALVETMIDRNITGIPIVDDDGRLLGIVTEADLVDKQAYGEPPQGFLDMVHHAVFGPPADTAQKAWAMTAHGLMTKNVHTAAPGDDVTSVARRLLERGIKRMPVVADNGVVVGIVSRRDLLAAYARPDAELTAAVRKVLANPLAVPEDARLEYLEVRDGVVRLAGSVNHPSDVAVTAAALRAIPGVVDVETRLSAREPDPELSLDRPIA